MSTSANTVGASWGLVPSEGGTQQVISCLISLVIVAIVVLIALFVVEAVLSAFGAAIPANVLMLVRLLAGLLVLLYGLGCLFGEPGGLAFPLRRCP